MDNWRKYARLLFKIEESYYPKILKVLLSVYSSFTSDLRLHGANTARNNLNMQTFNQELTPIITDLYQRVGKWGARLQYNELRDSIREGAKAGGFGRNEAWIQEVMNYLRLHAIRFVQNISDTTREDILKILERGQSENLTIDQIINELSGSGIVETRARTIARTEIVRAANVGHLAGAKSFPYEVNKNWQGAGDHRERHSHRLMNEIAIDETDLFKVPIYKGDKPTGAFDMMNAPGDPNAHPSNTINCRCRVTFKAKRDANGRLIMRRTMAPVVQLSNTSIDISPELEQIRASN
jgi:hypothetical protein